MTPAESADFDRREKERDDRLANTSIMTAAREYTALAHDWLMIHVEAALTPPDDVLHEALSIVEFDVWLIQAKLHRALDGCDRRREEGDEDEPVQNDSNGSASP